MTSRSQTLGAILFVGLALWSAIKVAEQPYGVIYVDLGNGRGPAAVRRSYDVSDLAGLALSKKIHERLVGDAHLLYRENEVGIELGQFVTDGDRPGAKRLTCSIYDRVQLVFNGDGEATSSHPPEMLVEGPCLNSAERVLWIEPIWIPYGEILGRPTTTGEVNYFDQDSFKLSLRFAYMSEQWPKRWVLDSIRLYNQERKVDDIIIERAAIRQAAPKSLVLNW